MPRGGNNKLSKETVIQRCLNVHHGKYDYSLMEFNTVKGRAKIVCPIHGVFEQIVQHHMDGCGCPQCGHDNNRKLVYGWGINDVYDVPTRSKLYHAWKEMIGRCYSQRIQRRTYTYIGCTVCEEWKRLSVFKTWFDENYRDGYELDKDILKKGNKTYCPEYCCFVPHRLNSIILKCNKSRGKYPIGVAKSGSKYVAVLDRHNKMFRIGLFDTAEEAFTAYKREKEEYIKKIVSDYYNKGLIDKKVYDALMKYEVEITD